MNESRHTPGPWEEDVCSVLSDEDDGSLTKFDDDECYRSIRAGGGYLDREGGKQGFTLTGYISPADARLIAAAPEMYKHLSAAFHALRSYEHGNSSPDLAHELASGIESILAKVEGRSSSAISEPARMVTLASLDNGGSWTVSCGNRYQDQLGGDEALWVLAKILMCTPIEGYLRTQAEHDAWHAQFASSIRQLEPWEKQLTAAEVSQ